LETAKRDAGIGLYFALRSAPPDPALPPDRPKRNMPPAPSAGRRRDRVPRSGRSDLPMSGCRRSPLRRTGSTSWGSGLAGASMRPHRRSRTWIGVIRPSGPSTCERRIFTERIPTVAASSARRTHRLAAWLTHVAFAVVGAPGARLLRHGGCTISRETLLGHIWRLQVEHSPTPTVLSVDDSAFRKGRTYGTIVVNLERHRVVDLLPDRNLKLEPET